MLSHRLAPTLCAIVALVAPNPATAADAWDTKRTTQPESLEELVALQAKVKGVVDKTSPATVGIIIGMGAGSGVIVSDDGLVLTAAHVSGEAGRTCRIILPDGRTVRGKTLGTNEKLDSGMIRITDKGPDDGKWPFIPLGKSAGLKKGQWVVSLGHPGGWKRGRDPVARLGQVQDTTKSLIRTNCTLVGGDSGGPLFDLDGKVVGIHSRIGFTLSSNIHVPADAFTADWDELVQGDEIGKPTKAAKAVLGVIFTTDGEAAKVTEVVSGGAAELGGMKDGDRIVEFDGDEVTTADEVREILLKKKPGDEVEVKVERGSKTVTLTVTLGKRSS